MAGGKKEGGQEENRRIVVAHNSCAFTHLLVSKLISCAPLLFFSTLLPFIHPSIHLSIHLPPAHLATIRASLPCDHLL